MALLIDMRRQPTRSNAPLEATEAIAPVPIVDVADNGSPRPHYRHAVIPGGAYSGDELAAALREDAVVAAHYRSVDPSRVRTTVTPAARMAYVSYRIGNRVFWTRKPVRIPAGETLLTDGEIEIRARCGNAVSDIAREPVSDVEPIAAELDEPMSDDSSVNGERDVVGSAAPYVPFLLPAQGAILGNDEPDLPAELQALGGTMLMLLGLLGGAGSTSIGQTSLFADAEPSPRGDESDQRVKGGASFLAGSGGSGGSGGNGSGDDGSAGEPDGGSNDPNGDSNPGDPGPGPGDGTVPKTYPGSQDVVRRRGRGGDSVGAGTRHAGDPGAGHCRGGRATPAARIRFQPEGRKWSGRLDSNQRPLGPEPSALPG